MKYYIPVDSCTGGQGTKMTQRTKVRRCPLCGGNRVSGTTTFSADLGTGVLIVRNVPAMICNQCGEEWIGDDAARRLEAITNDAKIKSPYVEIMAYK